MVEIMHIVLPYDLTEATLLEGLEDERNMTPESSFAWLLAPNGGVMDGERERIITATAALLQKGVELGRALDTAIVWERG